LPSAPSASDDFLFVIDHKTMLRVVVGGTCILPLLQKHSQANGSADLLEQVVILDVVDPSWRVSGVAAKEGNRKKSDRWFVLIFPGW
jgi:hypothetical protein